jgi:uncharacterized membrane protein
MIHEVVQKAIDDEHLKLLRYGYLIQGAITAMMVFIGIIYVFIGVLFSAMLSSSMDSSENSGGMEFVGLVYSIIGVVIIGVVVALATMYFLSAHYLEKRKHRVFIMVTAGISCFSIPWGTAIGIATFMVLNRPPVKDQFDGSTAGVQPVTYDPSIPPPPGSSTS